MQTLFVISIMPYMTTRERERTKEIGREGGSKRARERGRERERERHYTVHNNIDDPYELGTRCSTRSADGHFNTSNH